MIRPTRSSRFPRLAALLAVASLVCATTGSIRPARAAGTAPAAPPEARIIVLSSAAAGPARDVIEGFRRAVNASGTGAVVEVLPPAGDTPAMDEALRKILKTPPSLLFTIGSIAAHAATEKVRDIPIVSGLILNARELGGAPNATGVVLEFPVRTELEWMRRLLPGRNRIAVVYHAEENHARIAEAESLARGLGLTVEGRKVESALGLPEAFTALARNADVVWGLADPLVLNARTAQSILLLTLEERVPFVGLSLNWVKAGALYALDRDYPDIGAQCGALAAQILAGKKPGDLPPEPPRKVVYSVNQKVARILKIDLPRTVLKDAKTVVE